MSLAWEYDSRIRKICLVLLRDLTFLQILLRCVVVSSACDKICYTVLLIHIAFFYNFQAA